MKIEEKIKFLNKNTPIVKTFNKDTVVNCMHCKETYYAYECIIEVRYSRQEHREVSAQFS